MVVFSCRLHAFWKVEVLEADGLASIQAGDIDNELVWDGSRPADQVNVTSTLTELTPNNNTLRITNQFKVSAKGNVF